MADMHTVDSKEQLENYRLVFNSALFEEKAAKHADQTVLQFRKITRFYALFHIGYFIAGGIEVLTLLLFFPFFAKSSLLAFSFGLIFLTGFSYFVLRFYFQAKKPEQFLHLKLKFIEACKNSLPPTLDAPTYHASLIHAVYKLISNLDGQEHQYYALPKQFHTLASLLEKFSLWCHWKDVHQMKEILHYFCIEERINRIKEHPTDLDTHASLANSYIALYKEYLPRTAPSYTFIIKEYASDAMKKKFHHIASRAIEEFKILNTYVPNDPWIYAQLAAVYHDLNLPEKEIEAYETLLRTLPQDKELLFRCGVLYFQLGRTAEGLKIYEQLKNLKDHQAGELIKYYDMR